MELDIVIRILQRRFKGVKYRLFLGGLLRCLHACLYEYSDPGEMPSEGNFHQHRDSTDLCPLSLAIHYAIIQWLGIP